MGDVFLLVVGAVVGYVSGVLRALSESRNERRDAALADIYKELALFHRYLTSWTAADDPDPKKPTAASEGVAAREHVKGQFERFTHTFYDVNAIWVGKSTYELIHGFALASRDLLNDLNNLGKRDGVWRLPDGAEPNYRRRKEITPQYDRVMKALRAEVEASRGLLAWVRYQIDKGTRRRG